MRPFFSYYGSKYGLAKYYGVPPRDAVVVEPFAGSGAFSCYHNVRKAVLYDKYEEIIDLWNFLITALPEDILSIPDVIDDIREVPELQGMQRTFVRWNIAVNQSRPVNVMTPWAKDFRLTSRVWGPRFKRQTVRQLPLIRDWEAHCLSYEDIPIERFDENTWWFIDGPYRLKGYHYTHNDKAIDFNHLADWCRSLPGHVIVCEMAPADWLPFVPFRAYSGHQKNRYYEVVWCSDPSKFKEYEDGGLF